jgi:hypothetical protein
VRASTDLPQLEYSDLLAELELETADTGFFFFPPPQPLNVVETIAAAIKNVKNLGNLFIYFFLKSE